MANTIIIQIFNSKEYLFYYFCSLSFIEASSLSLTKFTKKITTHAQLRDKVKIFIVHVHFFKPNNVWVIYVHKNI